jgi:hypothetical protein
VDQAAFEEAVLAFWDRRRAQQDKQMASGKIDAGTRGAVTGGGHLNPIATLFAQVFRDAGYPLASVQSQQRLELPGYYRPQKKWDLLVVHAGILVAALELKSQVGPSFGNNFNNRTEEALGSAVDVWRAYEEGRFGDVKPWLGWFFLLEDAPGSTRPVGLGDGLFPVEKVFHRTSYKDRYAIFCQRLVRERLYDVALFVTSNADGYVDEPVAELSFSRMLAAVEGRIAYLRGLGIP